MFNNLFPQIKQAPILGSFFGGGGGFSNGLESTNQLIVSWNPVPAGSITYNGPTKAIKFTSSATLTVTTSTVTSRNAIPEVLIAAGGAGGNVRYSGGGGAGGLVYGTSKSFSSSGTYPIVVGAPATFLGATAVSNGSGSGNGRSPSPGGSAQQPSQSNPGWSQYGNPGGRGKSGGSGYAATGGGGGAGGGGGDAPGGNQVGGNGGSGRGYSIDGGSKTYCHGANGGNSAPAGPPQTTPGSANFTGSGSGGNAGNGGSVIFRVPGSAIII